MRASCEHTRAHAHKTHTLTHTHLHTHKHTYSLTHTHTHKVVVGDFSSLRVNPQTGNTSHDLGHQPPPWVEPPRHKRAKSADTRVDNGSPAAKDTSVAGEQNPNPGHSRQEGGKEPAVGATAIAGEQARASDTDFSEIVEAAEDDGELLLRGWWHTLTNTHARMHTHTRTHAQTGANVESNEASSETSVASSGDSASRPFCFCFVLQRGSQGTGTWAGPAGDEEMGAGQAEKEDVDNGKRRVRCAAWVGVGDTSVSLKTFLLSVLVVWILFLCLVAVICGGQGNSDGVAATMILAVSCMRVYASEVHMYTPVYNFLDVHVCTTHAHTLAHTDAVVGSSGGLRGESHRG